MSDNPFAEADDNEATIIRPIPGGRLAPGQPLADPLLAPVEVELGTTPTEAHPGESGPRFADLPQSVGSPIISAAAGCLSLLGRLRNAFSVPDPRLLREHAVQELRRFEQALRRQNLPMEQLRPAHYALCACLDDVVQATPWGSRGAWADASLVSTFHNEVRSGERFFDLLAQLRQNPGQFLHVLELMYLCMSLGMQGRYRLSPRGPAELDRVREETYVLIKRNHAPTEPALSPHWQGVAAPYERRRFVLPLWVGGIIGLGLIGLVYAWAVFGLSGQSDRLFAAGLTLPPGHLPAIKRELPPAAVPSLPPPPTSAISVLGGFLAPEVKQGLVSVVGTDALPIVRINNRGLFASGSATVEPQFQVLLRRIGAALALRPGPVQVLGYTDNQPIHTIQFPSNFQLSAARAQAAASVIGAASGPKNPISAEGRADADPIASNDTPEGRAENRRIEVVLHQAGAAQ
ncbi:type VI secretion system protein TssL, long form [Acidisoma cellulosilytica]|uniref:Type VI secretion system protein TssL, long form n=1 Tax=Acidisoma cellulosilyticum TaxID=2802395 RepID=A0A963Z3B2_9PROT|nr:type VI secretion system protein TssL, long form [Acidisoma cellulosilyticum]MCB8881033.1 type VI secretion system protein TssL, long form [Acidisoma cellulosilyticum]